MEAFFFYPLRLKFDFVDFVTQNFEPGYAAPKPAPYGFNPQAAPYANAPSGVGTQMPQLGNVFGQPVVQDMAFQYSQQVFEKCSCTNKNLHWFIF